MVAPNGRPKNAPPAWLDDLPCPPCFEPDDWRRWLADWHAEAKAPQVRALQRGEPPPYCADCVPGSRHKLRALMLGTCIPIVSIVEEPEPRESTDAL